MKNQVALKVIHGKLQGMAFTFDERTICIIGRARDCNIKLPDDKDHETISRYHCLLDINPPSVRVRDFGSRNGTFVNGKKIGQRKKGQSIDEVDKTGFPEIDLAHMDKIKLGTTVFQVSIEGTQKSAPQPTRAEPEEPLHHTPDLDELSQHIQHFPELAGIRDYLPTRELGRGGMGAVYLARHKDSGEQVALKVMLPQVAVSNEARDMFLRETKNTEALHHPNLVQLHHSGCHDDTFFFTLEYCDSGSLLDLTRERGGRMSVDEALPLILQALDGLHYAHTAAVQSTDQPDGSVMLTTGLVHRDLKPANIYLTSGEDGQLVAKIGDFGLAKAFDTAGLSGQTATGSVGGTPVFMPRQQILNFKYAKPQVDVWAMAATLYKTLTGSYPRDFPRGEDPWLTALKNAPVPIRDRNPEIPEALAKVIDSALVDNPELLFTSAEQLKTALETAYNT
ncbi:MAG: serine/threonine-protein kinase [Gammaproteobacteria bacterium]|nr:serine/threonine-protein kinase [Gammaproteobacteria bacterium]